MKKIPKIKKQQDIFSKKNSSLIFVFSMLFFFYGVFIALAQSPDLPSNEKKGGWLGEILNLEKTNSEKLIFESEYVGVGINDPQV